MNGLRGLRGTREAEGAERDEWAEPEGAEGAEGLNFQGCSLVQAPRAHVRRRPSFFQRGLTGLKGLWGLREGAAWG